MEALESAGNFRLNFNVCRMLDGLCINIDAPLSRKPNPNFDVNDPSMNASLAVKKFKEDIL
jgi:hypothetical protein